MCYAVLNVATFLSCKRYDRLKAIATNGKVPDGTKPMPLATGTELKESL